MTPSTQSERQCADCGTPVRPGDGGRRAHGLLFCSEECIDSYEDGCDDALPDGYMGSL